MSRYDEEPDPHDDEIFEERARELAWAAIEKGQEGETDVLCEYLKETLQVDPLTWLAEHAGIETIELVSAIVDTLKQRAADYCAL